MKLLFAIVLISSACARTSPEPAAPPAAAPVTTHVASTPVGTAAPAEPAQEPAPSDTPAPFTREALFQEMQGFADRMCECHDSQCAQQVADDMQTWSREAEKRADPPHMSEQDVQHASAIGERMGRCMQQAMTNGSAAP